MKTASARILATCFAFLASLQISASQHETDINILMLKTGNQMLELLPVVYSQDYEQQQFDTELRQLRDNLREAQNHFSQTSANNQIPYEFLMQRLDQALLTYTPGNLLMSKRLTAQSFSLCFSCHQQDGIQSSAFRTLTPGSKDKFIKGQFHYLTRDYEAATATFEEYLTEKTVNPTRRSVALDRLLSIMIEVRNDTESAIKLLDSLAVSVELSQRQRERLGDWTGAIRRLQNVDRQISRDEPIESLDNFLTNKWPQLKLTLNVNEQQVYWLWVRHQLNAALTSNNKEDDLPVVYYWLAVSDRSTYFQFYNSVSRHYLEQCVRDFPQHPYARKCFDEYEFLLTTSYVNSSGRLSPAIQQSLEALRVLIK